MNIRTLNDLHNVPRGAAVSVGMFDGVHRGHQKVLQSLCRFAEEIGTLPLVITFDQHPRLVLSNQTSDFYLLNTNSERFSLIERCGIQNLLLIHFSPEVASLSACQFTHNYLLKKLAIKGLMIGYDNMFGNKQCNDFHLIPDMADKCNFKVAHEGSVSENGLLISSTQIRKALGKGDIALANNMLGYKYQIEGCVVEGRHIGRTLNFPTANIQCSDKLKMIPADGVYCAEITIDNRSHDAMCNIGAQPTFNGKTRTIEVHIFDFQQDIYNKEITLRFLEKIRDIHKFNSSEELVNQLIADKKQCLQHLSEIRRAR